MPGDFDWRNPWPGIPSPTVTFLQVCPVCFKTQFCYCSPGNVKGKLREIYDAMLDAWLGPREQEATR